MKMELSLAKRVPLSSSKPLMLKDFLVDDLSSCSSSGFRSYPRRECRTTVRFLLEIDLKDKPAKHEKKNKQPLVRTPLKPEPGPAAAPISAFHKASEAIIKAVKHLPFASFQSSTHPSSPSKLKLGILPRSLSRKFLSKRSFWKKNDHKEIQMWRPIINHPAHEEEKSWPQRDFIISPAATAPAVGGGISSNSSTSESTTNSVNWSDSDFTTSDESLDSSTANSSTTKIPEENNKNVLPIDGVVSSKKVGVIIVGGGGGDSSTDVNQPNSNKSSTNSNSPNATRQKSWPNEEKEQFSPVSVLDCPFEDDEEDEVSSSSPFQNRLGRVKGTKKRLIEKIMRFELLTQLEPLNLLKRIAVSESDQESNESIQDDQFVHDIEETAEEKASEFLEILKCTMAPLSPDSPPNNIKPNIEKLLFDFFKLGYLESENSSREATPRVEELLTTAKDWINGKSNTNEQVLEWKVKKNRETYIRDMERGGEWRSNLDNKEKEEVAFAIEVDIFASLINELLDDLLH